MTTVTSLRPSPAHPRSRGEHWAGVSATLRATGSSPLTRGARIHGDSLHLVTGLIPAHAGSTSLSCCGLVRFQAHPRSRGEHRRGLAGFMQRFGSSPLTRGARRLCWISCLRIGLIPAHAGSTSGPRREYPRTWAHPRSRGEHRIVNELVTASCGSSPLTRGARLMVNDDNIATRLIPAHAGSTLEVWVNGTRGRAHPRSRGEHADTIGDQIVNAGSSPLTRGALSTTKHPATSTGLIPAHAGSTSTPTTSTSRSSAHPRSRGEHTGKTRGYVMPNGSSPLTRGARTRLRISSVSVRLIPAHAGSTSFEPFGVLTPGAHPRSRGEHSTFMAQQVLTDGSSPLTRGALEESGVC